MFENQEGEIRTPWGEAQGAELAAWLQLAVDEMGSLPVGEPGRGVLTEMALAAARVEAWAVAIKAKAAAALFDDFTAEQEEVPGQTPTQSRQLADRAARASVSLALGVSLPVAGRVVDLGYRLDEQPVVAEALATAQVDERQARIILDGVDQLTDPVKRARLVQAFLADPTDPDSRATLTRPLRRDHARIWATPPHQLRGWVADVVAVLEPASVTDDDEVATQDRRVGYDAGEGARMAELILTGPKSTVAACYDRLDAQARAAKQSGLPETLDQLRFDLAAGLLTAGMFGLVVTTKDQPQPTGSNRPGRPLINITVPETTLRGQDDRPAILHAPSGDVPISALVARELASRDDAIWRTVVCDPASGAATDISATYRPTARLREFVKVRDGHTTRFPTSAARVVELDHVVEFDHAQPADGGQTTSANLASAGKWDHQGKTDRLITVTGDANGVLTYSTGTGHTYRSHPHTYVGPDLSDPEPEPPPDYGDPPF
jgi:Domain of unknown function (DUF222)